MKRRRKHSAANTLRETDRRRAKQVISIIRFNQKDWCVAITAAEYVSGTASSDHDENSEVIWLDIDEALTRDDVPDLTKRN